MKRYYAMCKMIPDGTEFHFHLIIPFVKRGSEPLFSPTANRAAPGPLGDRSSESRVIEAFLHVPAMEGTLRKAACRFGDPLRNDFLEVLYRC